MKKFILSLIFVGLMSVPVFASAYSEQFEDWRSTVAISPNIQVIITTGIVYVDRIIVSSGSGVFSSCVLFDATGTALGITITTKTHVMNTSETGTVFYIQKTFKKGFGYWSNGTADLDIKWNYPYSIPVGKESLGY